MDKLHVADIRKEYRLSSLDEKEVNPSPFVQFEKWFNEVLHSEVEEPNAMTLATSSPEGKPSARIVLLKGFDDDGFVFYTNFFSKKGMQLEQNNHAALVFFWKPLERQVRVEGIVEKVGPAISDKYFLSRPEGSRLGAWASHQSSVISSRQELEANMEKIRQEFAGKTITRPDYWGGFRLRPKLIEFWQGRSNRLHDRILYTLQAGNWQIERLAP